MVSENNSTAMDIVMLVNGDGNNCYSLELLNNNDIIERKIESFKELNLERKNTDVYILKSKAEGEILGYITVSPYEKIDNTKEISLRLSEPFHESGLIEEVIKSFINGISEDKNVENICIKAENNDSKLIEILQNIGFLKEGLFISNQLKKGEFSYHTIFRYKL